MKWLIQPVKIEAEKINLLMRFLKIAEIDFDIVYPLEGKVFNENKELYQYDENETYFVCGSYPLTRNVFKDRKEAVFSLDEYSFKDWYRIFGSENMVNENPQIVEAKDIKWINEEMFVRPLLDTKSFNGGIYNRNTLSFNGICVVAPIKEIKKEFRFFVINGEIIGSTQYKLNGELYSSYIVDEGAKEFASKMIKKFKFDGYVIDIAQVDDDYKIVELNCLNASGFYEINLNSFINGVINFYENRNVKSNQLKLKGIKNV